MSTEKPEFLPLMSLRIDGVDIPTDRIEGGAIFHDIDNGTVSVTFVGVRTVETVYHPEQVRQREPVHPDPVIFCTCPPVEGHPLTPFRHGPTCPMRRGL